MFRWKQSLFCWDFSLKGEGIWMSSFQMWLLVQARAILRLFARWHLGRPGFLYSLERKVYVTCQAQEHHRHNNLFVRMVFDTASYASYHTAAKEQSSPSPPQKNKKKEGKELTGWLISEEIMHMLFMAPFACFFPQVP